MASFTLSWRREDKATGAPARFALPEGVLFLVPGRRMVYQRFLLLSVGDVLQGPSWGASVRGS